MSDGMVLNTVLVMIRGGVFRKVLFVGMGIMVVLMFSLYAQLDMLPPTGPYPVGLTTLRWVDHGRPEVMTNAASDTREVIATIWYPAEPANGVTAPYFPELAGVAEELVASGEVSALEVFGLRYIRSNSFLEAAISSAKRAYPVVLLSPGNATNVEFYAGLADELASHGYVVVGLNHPYDVAAVALSDGNVAQFAADYWPVAMEARMAAVQERIDVRVQDALFLLDQLEELNASDHGSFAGRLDLAHLGIMGHSLGGVTAAQACQRDQRWQACLNLDGIQAGGPFSAYSDPELPPQPVMMITKEAQLPAETIEQFETLLSGGFQVIISSASHDHFTDGPLLMPSLLPLPNQAERITAAIRSYMLAFFDQTLKGESSPLLAKSSHDQQVVLKVYPAN